MERFSLVEYHEELVWKVSALMEYHEELVWKVSALMEYHEELVEAVTLVELWASPSYSWSAVRYSVDGTDQHMLVCGQ